jgi:hypothetical protein
MVRRFNGVLGPLDLPDEAVAPFDFTRAADTGLRPR